MNILLISYYPFESGGVGTSTYHLARALEKMGNKVIIASTEAYPDFETHVFKPVRYLPILQARDAYLTGFFSRLIKRYDIDIIHSSDLRFTGNGAMAAAKSNKIPCAVHYRDYWFGCLKGDLLYQNKTQCEGMRLGKCLKCNGLYRAPWEAYKYGYFKKRITRLAEVQANMAVSCAVKEKMLSAGIEKNVAVVYDLFPEASNEMAAIDKRPGMFTVLFAGKMIYHRGIETLMKVAERVGVLNQEIFFKIAGDGEMLDFAKRYAEQHGLKNVEFLGHVKHLEMAKLQAGADIYFFPSLLAEPFSRGIIEMMQQGKPVIASNLGGTKEVIEDGQGGYLVDPLDFEACAQKIVSLASQPELIKKMGAVNLAKSKEFSEEAVAKKIFDLYTEAIRSKS
ncbi:glycosyltransferase family 4 protein [Candidatus Falkowbacteria bacterium]|nr:glycosyltransferase family 4 protein [Candidatus Falkowbacteria bacterium]